MRVQFGDLALDTDRRQLLRGGTAMGLSPKAYALLELLVASRPKAVSKFDIHEALWPKTFVVESNLRALVTEVRAAVADDARRPRFIRTVFGFGYAFCGETSGTRDTSPRPPSGVVHMVTWGWNELDLEEGENVLGRDSDATIWIGDDSISRRHARIVVREGEAILEDLGSKNGTYLGSGRLTAPAPLKSGDEIRIGLVRMVYRKVSVLGSTRTAE